VAVGWPRWVLAVARLAELACPAGTRLWRPSERFAPDVFHTRKKVGPAWLFCGNALPRAAAGSRLLFLRSGCMRLWQVEDPLCPSAHGLCRLRPGLVSSRQPQRGPVTGRRLATSIRILVQSSLPLPFVDSLLVQVDPLLVAPRMSTKRSPPTNSPVLRAAACKRFFNSAVCSVRQPSVFTGRFSAVLRRRAFSAKMSPAYFLRPGVLAVKCCLIVRLLAAGFGG